VSFDLQSALLLAGLLAAGVWTVMTADLLRSAIGLAVTSAVLTLALFLLGAPLAAVFELSVCAGLITVVFVSTISLTKPWGVEAALSHKQVRLRRFAFLPLLLFAAMLLLRSHAPHLDLVAPPPAHPVQDVREALWIDRRLDLVGQILIILAGVFGVVVLFKTRDAARQEKKP
jgi:NADH-quinone oxidoreductase subunit J